MQADMLMPATSAFLGHVHTGIVMLAPVRAAVISLGVPVISLLHRVRKIVGVCPVVICGRGRLNREFLGGSLFLF